MYFGLFVALNVLCMKMEINVNENCAGVESEYNLNGNIGMLREKNPRIDKKEQVICINWSLQHFACSEKLLQ